MMMSYPGERLDRVVGAALVVVIVAAALITGLHERRARSVAIEFDTSRVDEAQLRRARLMDDPMSAREKIGGPFALIDQTGARRALSDFRGKLVLLYFGYTSCPDICPSDLSQIAETMRVLGAENNDLQPVFITVDPERDTAVILGAYLTHFGPRFVGLTGSNEEIREVADRYRVYFQKSPINGRSGYAIDHTANIYLLDRDGEFTGSLPPGTKAKRLLEVARAQLGRK